MYSFRISNLNNIDNYLSIFKQNFKGHLFSKKYLIWLYRQNFEKKIFGIDTVYKNKIVGHCGGIPIKFIYKKKVFKSLLCINICLNDIHRKKGLIDKAQKRLLSLSEKKKIDFIFTIANKAAKKSWLRSIDAKILRPLEVKLFYNLKFKNNISKIFSKTMYPDWPQKKIDWRIKSPRSKFKIKQIRNLKFLINKISIFRSISPIKIAENKKSNGKMKYIVPNIFIGIGFKRIFDNCFAIELPLFLRPSPLYFIYKIINKSKLKEKNFKDIQFSIADFDVY